MRTSIVLSLNRQYQFFSGGVCAAGSLQRYHFPRRSLVAHEVLRGRNSVYDREHDHPVCVTWVEVRRDGRVPSVPGGLRAYMKYYELQGFGGTPKSPDNK